MKKGTSVILHAGVISVILLSFILSLLGFPQPVYAAGITVEPITWNIIGLDSNTPASGPYRFPVGARVCISGYASFPVTVTANFVWDDGLGLRWGDTTPPALDPYINLRQGSLTSTSLKFTDNGCQDAYFEVEVKKVAEAFDKVRRYHITATDGTITASTPTPRELYVEHLISQNRNGVTDIKLNGVSIPAGGEMNLVVGNTYTIDLVGGTATQGYNQFESFINFPNTIFQIVSKISNTPDGVLTDYAANTSSKIGPTTGGVTDYQGLYADACTWENNPGSPNYRSCIGGDYKTGGAPVTTSYTIKIIGGGGTQQTLNSLLYDFSGSSFHYNSDYSLGFRIANIIDPATALNFSKSFNPARIAPDGTSMLTFTIHNNTSFAISGLNFKDTFPTAPGAMKTATPATYTTTGCGSPKLVAPIGGASFQAGQASFAFSDGTVAANSDCIIVVNVTAPTASVTTYDNTSDKLFIGTADTTKTTNTANLTVDAAAVTPGTGICGVQMAFWNMGTVASAVPPAPTATLGNNVDSASARFVPLNTATSSIVTTNPDNLAGSSGTGSWQSEGYPKNTAPTFATASYYEFSVVSNSKSYKNVTLQLDEYGSSSFVGGNLLYVWSSTDGTTWNPITLTTPDPITASTWVRSSPYPATNTGANTTTYFRISAEGANNLSTKFNIDDVKITGCAIPQTTLTKNFSPNPVVVGGTSTMTFNLTNGNGANLTGAKFSDTLPAGLEYDTATLPATTCLGSPSMAFTGTNVFDFGKTDGGTIPNAGCTVTVKVKATTAGPHQNISDFIYTTEGGTNSNPSGSAQASLVAVLPPTIDKNFNPSTILAGEPSRLTFVLTNPNPDNDLPGVAFKDTLPTGMTLVPPVTSGQCGGTVSTSTSAEGRVVVDFSGGTVTKGSYCEVKIDVTASGLGDYPNTSDPVTTTVGGLTVGADTANAKLTVTEAHPSISIMKRISTSASGPWYPFLAVAPGTPVYYQFTVENTGDVNLDNVSVSDPTLTALGLSLASCAWSPLNRYSDAVTCVTASTPALSGSNPNTATAQGTYTIGGQTKTASSSALYVGANAGKLSLVKQVSTSPSGPWSASVSGVQPGSTVYYKLTIVNATGGPLTSINVTDADVATTGCSFTNPLPDGGATSCVVSATVSTTDLTKHTNTATAHGTDGSSTVINSDPSSADYTPLAADLEVIKSNDKGGSVSVGTLFTWTVTVKNIGTDTATFTTGKTVLSDTLPAGATYTNFGDPALANLNCALDTISDPDTITCTASGDFNMAPGDSFAVTVDTTPSAAGDLENTAVVDPGTIIPESDEGNNQFKDTVIVTKVTPSITTTASPTTGTVGTQVNNAGDSATLAGGYNPTGSVTFTLYSNNTCTTAVAGMSGSGTISGGSASWSQNWTPTATGTYYWQASYAGDANNNAVTSGCTDANEQIAIGKATPSITTTASPTTGTVGTQVTNAGDSATLTGGYNPTGSVTFTLYSNNTCTTAVPGMSGSGTISSGSASWSQNWTPTAAGTYYWQASYGGDANNNAVTSGCTDANEQIVISAVTDLLPVANDDTNTATENGTAVTGNVRDGGVAAGDVADSLGDTPTTVTAASQGTSTITIGTAFSTVAGGSLTLNADGTYSYTPPAWNDVPPGGLTETFNYTITDADGDTDNATLTITVDDNDRVPAANDDTNTAQENGPAVTGNVRDGGVAAGDSADDQGDSPATVTAADQGGTTITIGSAFATAAGGSLTLNTDGTYSYTPSAWNLIPPAGLTETFNYTITDADGDTSSTTLTITVTDSDRLPIANADTNTAQENGPAVTGNVRDGGVAAGDSADSLGDTPTTVTAASQGTSTITIGTAFSTAAGGSLTLNADGTYSYTPPAWNDVPPAGLTETFNYTITDVDSDTSSATLTITVQNANLPPVANDNSTSTQINKPVTFNVTGNDTDSDGTVNASTVDLDPATPGQQTSYSVTGEGTFMVDNLGNVTFTPTATFTGTSTIPYTVQDNDGGVSNQANLSVNVGNNPPTATDNEASVDDANSVHTANMITGDEGNGVDTDPDSDPLTVAQVDGETNPANSITGVYGTLDWAADGTYTYTLDTTDPDYLLLAAGAIGTETFPYTISDGFDTDSANIIITVTGADDAPVANDDSFPPIDEDTSLNGDLKPDNDLGADVPSGDGGNEWYLVSDAPNGTVTVNTDGTFTYDPDPDYNGPDSFIYEICDVDGDCESATVYLTVSPVDDPAIGIAKSLVNISRLGSGKFKVTLVFHIRNYGDVALMNVQVTDDLSKTFPAPSTFTVLSVNINNRTGAALTKNTDYDGSASFPDLLDASSSTLEPGSAADITVVVDVIPASSEPFFNSAIASGMTPTERPVEDISSDGSDPDNTANCQTCVNGDGDPTNNTKETEITFDPNIFDPPFGFKELDPTGLPVLRWTMVWINDNNFPTFASVIDPISVGTTYEATGASSGYPIPAWALGTSTNVGVSCTTDSAAEAVPDAETTTIYCFYEPPTSSYPYGRVYWEGFLGPDMGATDQTNANDELYITFTVRVADGVTRVQNTASLDADLNNDTDAADPGEQVVANTQAVWQEPATPVDGREGKKLPATGFAPGKITPLPAQTSEQAYSDLGDLWLEIPSLGVKTSIVGVPKNAGAWSVDWLWQQAGWLEGTAFPTWQGNSVVTGHVYLPNGKPGPFIDLNKLRFGNQVIVHVFGQRYVYEIQTNHIILPTDMSPFKHEQKAWLTLLTCKGYDESTDTYKYRIAARAVLVKVVSE